jgi:hypothetical protein
LSVSDSTPSPARRPISKKLRFEVFKRDSFTCQYCGRKAPDVILQVDHIHPRSKGGKDNILNYITSCVDCNAGKFNEVLEKQRRQLEELQERKEQIEMMFDWQRSLFGLEEHARSELAAFWCELVPGYSLNALGMKQLTSLQRRFGIEEVLVCMRLAAEQYIKTDERGLLNHNSVNEAWDKVGRICTWRKRYKDNPGLDRLYYIRGILRNRLKYLNQATAIDVLKQAYAAGVSLEDLQDMAKEAISWSSWRDLVAAVESVEDGTDGETP